MTIQDPDWTPPRGPAAREALAQAIAKSAGVSTIHGGIALTSAHLDAAAGANGFGGLAFVPGFGGFGTGQQQP